MAVPAQPVLFLDDAECRRLAELYMYLQDVDTDICLYQEEVRQRHLMGENKKREIEKELSGLYYTHRNRAMHEGYPKVEE